MSTFSTAPIGVFDSGIGGLTVLFSCMQALPMERFLYWGDNGNAPYGIRSEEEIFSLSCKALDELSLRGVKGVVIACNTVTTNCISRLRERYPFPIVGTEPAVRLAEGCKRPLLLATRATLSAPATKRLIGECGREILCYAPPFLVEKIEKYAPDFDAAEIYADLKKIDCDGLILGCTHFVFLKEGLSRYYGGVPVFDGNQGIARRLATFFPPERGSVYPLERGSVYPPEQSRGCSPERGSVYPPEQSRGYSSEQSSVYPPEQGSVYPPEQSRGYSPEQSRGYSPEQGRVYPPERGRGYSPEQSRGCSPEQSGVYPPEQGSVYLPEQSRGYSPEQGSVYPTQLSTTYPTQRSTTYPPKPQPEPSPTQSPSRSPTESPSQPSQPEPSPTESQPQSPPESLTEPLTQPSPSQPSRVFPPPPGGF